MSADHEAVGRAVERIAAAGAGWIRTCVITANEGWGALATQIKGEPGNNLTTTYTYSSSGEALIALAELVDPSWETWLRERCEELGIGFDVLDILKDDSDSVLARAVRAVDPPRETACRAALAALDVLYPPLETSA